jgi:cysteinyl-tRNA synthetase
MSIVRLREEYRKNKDWQKSDLLRDDLIAKGWLVKDTSDGSKLTKI